jgi:hypothetical protein
MLWFFPKKPIFTPSQIDRMANILDNAGQGFFVVLVLTPLVAGIDRANPPVLILGAGAMVICWITSLLLARMKDKNL